MNTKPVPDLVRQAKLKLWLGVGTIVVIGFIIAFYVVFVGPAAAPTVNTNAVTNTANSNRLADIALVDATPQPGSTVEEFSTVTITFSEPIDPTSLSQDNFYVLQGIEDKAPATITVSDDGETATAMLAEARSVNGDTVQAYTIVVDSTTMQGANAAAVYVPGGKATWNVYVAAEPYTGN